jgi:predicted DNA-binding protein YlxM (UPF0122 family)
MSLPEQIDFSIIKEFAQRGDQVGIAKRLEINKQTVHNAINEKSRNWAVIEEQLKICVERAAKIKRYYDDLLRYKIDILKTQKEIEQLDKIKF